VSAPLSAASAALRACWKSELMTDWKRSITIGLGPSSPPRRALIPCAACAWLDSDSSGPRASSDCATRLAAGRAEVGVQSLERRERRAGARRATYAGLPDSAPEAAQATVGRTDARNEAAMTAENRRRREKVKQEYKTTFESIDRSSEQLASARSSARASESMMSLEDMFSCSASRQVRVCARIANDALGV